jgi:hypothetical protein
MRSKWLACLLVLSACPDVSTDNNETAGPVVEFDPANSIVPFPNNLILDPATGKVNLPPQACESTTAAALRTGVLNKLDGFGTYETAITVTLTATPDEASAATSVYLYKRAPVASTTPIPVVVRASATGRFNAADCTAAPTPVPELVIIPRVPLDPNSTYTVAVVGGLTDGTTPFTGSFVWGLVRQAMDPVTLADGCDHATYANCTVLANNTPIPMPTGDTDPNLAQLVGLDLLWNVHAPMLKFLDGTGVVDPTRSNLLVAFDFNTQTTSAPLDPLVANSPAAKLSSAPLLGTFSVASAKGAPCNAGTGCTTFMSAVGIPCGTLPCNAVGDVIGAGLTTQPYQVLGPNAFAPTMLIPGAWTDPVNPTAQAGVVLQVLAFTPNGTPPPFGWPVVVFGHGLTRQKEDLFALASQLASIGFASVAIDMQAHGSRAVPISKDAAAGCAGTCFTSGGTDTGTACDTVTPCSGTDTCINAFTLPVTAPESPQCYAPFLGADLAGGRDNIRQTVLDQLRLVNALKACGPGNCTYNGGASTFSVDPDHIFYTGQSMGGIVGSITSSASNDFKASVLNVTGVGIFDLAENTANLFFRCSFVNALIDAGVLTGAKWDPTNPTVGLCTGDTWKSDPAYLQFSAIGRWVLDSADPANYVKGHPGFAGLVAKHFLQQEVGDDQVVPNLASDNQGMLVGKTPANADPAISGTPAASAAITAMPTESKWLKYPTLPADSGTGFPGNTFAHGSLLAPANANTDGALGTARMQSDAFHYLGNNY